MLESPVTQLNVNPFFLKQLTGNIRVCQGCRGNLQQANGNIPDPPYDMVVAQFENRPYRDASGTLKTPYRVSAAHYHARFVFVHVGDPGFVPSLLVIPQDVLSRLSGIHQQHLKVEFGLFFSR